MSLFDWAGLAAVTFGAAVLQAAGGFGFAVLATPLFLLFVEPEHAVQLVIVVSSVLSIVVLPHMWRSIAPRLLLRLARGSLLGPPLGLVALGPSDPRPGRAGGRGHRAWVRRGNRGDAARRARQQAPDIRHDAWARSHRRGGIRRRHCA